jgi:hypothetical protein
MIFPLPYSLPLRNSILFDEYELLSSLSHKGKNRKGSTPYANKRNRKRKNRIKRK